MSAKNVDPGACSGTGTRLAAALSRPRSGSSPHLLVRRQMARRDRGRGIRNSSATPLRRTTGSLRAHERRHQERRRERKEARPRAAGGRGDHGNVGHADARRSSTRRRAKWTVLRKKEKPAAEIFSVSYVAAGDDADRPVTFVFNGGPGAASAYLHMGAVGPQRVDFPPDGTLPTMPPRLVENESSWLALLRPRVRRPGRHGLQPRDRAGEEGRRRQGRRASRTTRPTRRSTSATSATSSRCASSWAAGSPSTAAGARRSSSPARATAAIASGVSRACSRRRRASA